MKNSIILLLITNFFLMAGHVISQHVQAGVVPPGGSYTDIIPDKLFQGEMFMSNNNPPDSLLIDLDDNHTYDVIFMVMSGGSQIGGGTRCKVFPLHDSITIIGDTNITYVYPSPPFQKTLLYCLAATPIHQRHTIDNHFHYYNTECFIYDDGWTFSISPMNHVNIWDNRGDYFLGFRLRSKNDTITGWIRIEVIRAGSIGSIGTTYEVLIKDYASNLSPLSVFESTGKTHPLALSPNPSTGTVTLTMEPATFSPVTVRVFDATGSLVYRTATEVSLPASLDLSHLPNGIYLIQATSSQFHVSKKLMLNP